jgi:hypothetical protein
MKFVDPGGSETFGSDPQDSLNQSGSGRQDPDPFDPTLNTRCANQNGTPDVLVPGLALGVKPACNTYDRR